MADGRYRRRRPCQRQPGGDFVHCPHARTRRTRSPVIAVENLSRRFPLSGGGELTAVDGLSFAVAPGEVYGLLGPNGAGKTTTLRMLLGLLAPSAGHAVVAGFSSADEPDEV